MPPDKEMIMKEVEEIIVITMKMVREDVEEEAEEAVVVEEETTEVKKEVKDKKDLKVEDNIEAEEEAEEIVMTEVKTEETEIMKRAIEEKEEFTKIRKPVDYQKIRNKPN